MPTLRPVRHRGQVANSLRGAGIVPSSKQLNLVRRKAAIAHNKTPQANVADDGSFWQGTPEQLADRLRPYVELGFRTIISEQPAPYDVETFERFIGEVVPLLRADRG